MVPTSPTLRMIIYGVLISKDESYSLATRSYQRSQCNIDSVRIYGYQEYSFYIDIYPWLLRIWDLNYGRW